MRSRWPPRRPDPFAELRASCELLRRSPSTLISTVAVTLPLEAGARAAASMGRAERAAGRYGLQARAVLEQDHIVVPIRRRGPS